MTAWFNRLNLPPTERRFVLAGLVLVFLLLNYWLVWPYFREWDKVSSDLRKFSLQKSKYLEEITKKSGYDNRLKQLQGMGAQLQSDDAANRLQQTIYTEAGSAGVTINRLIPQVQPTRTANNQTNQFFDDHVAVVEVSAGEGELVDFLYKLGSGDSLIRVRDVSNLRLDPSLTRLQASLTLVASFQKKNPTPATPAPPARKSSAAAIPSTSKSATGSAPARVMPKAPGSATNKPPRKPPG